MNVSNSDITIPRVPTVAEIDQELAKLDRLLIRKTQTCKIVDGKHIATITSNPIICPPSLANKYIKYNSLIRIEPCHCADTFQPIDNEYHIEGRTIRIHTKSVPVEFNKWHVQVPLPLPNKEVENWSDSDSDLEQFILEADAQTNPDN